MRFLEQCPYITPCGYCSRLGKECEESRKKPKNLKNSDLRNVRVNMERTVVIIFAFQGDAKCFL